MREPRGHKDMFGVFLTPPSSPDYDAGLIYIDGTRVLPHVRPRHDRGRHGDGRARPRPARRERPHHHPFRDHRRAWSRPRWPMTGPRCCGPASRTCRPMSRRRTCRSTCRVSARSRPTSSGAATISASSTCAAPRCTISPENGSELSTPRHHRPRAAPREGQDPASGLGPHQQLQLRHLLARADDRRRLLQERPRLLAPASSTARPAAPAPAR